MFIVGIGASAGGLVAIEQLLEALPADTGSSFVFIQHLDPKQESHTPAILGGRTAMSVRQAVDGAPVGVDELWTIPPGSMVELEDGALRVRERPAEPMPSVIDRFLVSLARERGSAAIGVLLSGSGSDGTIGLKAVHEKGGLTMVQDPETAEFGDMTRSAIDAGWADHVLAIDELAAMITQTLRRGLLAVPLAGVDDEHIEALVARTAELLHARVGHDFDLYKKGTLVRRLGRRAALRGAADLSAYVERLQDDPEEVEALFRDLLISVTEFFRDPAEWEALARDAIPRIFAMGGADEPVRAWVPGCATGEEAYTLSMLLHEHAAAIDSRRDITIFGSDADERALQFAREGRYSGGISEHVSKERLERFFTRDNDHHRVKSVLRESCIFATHDLLKDPPFSRLDLVCCRNVLIYLERAGQERVLSALQYALKPGGYLFLGLSESLVAHADLLEQLDEQRIFRRTAVAHPPPIQTLAGRHGRARAAGQTAGGDRSVQRRQDGRTVVEQVLLRRYGPACVVVDDRREVLYFVGRTGKYLEPSGARARDGLNVLDMAQPRLRSTLRSALAEAERKGTEVERPGVAIDIDGRTDQVDVLVRPAHELGIGSKLMMIVFREAAPPRQATELQPPAADAESQVVRQLERELHDTRQRLDATIEDLEVSNEELRSSNEELLSMNEELQTAKEEAQSINEELKTVNQDLKQNIAELDVAHSVLQNLFHSTEIATLFLDRDFRIERFTPSTTELFSLREVDIGRPLAEIASLFADKDLIADCREVLRTLIPRQRQVRMPHRGAWYTLRIFPYRTIDDVIDGVVLTFTDVSDLMRAEEQLREKLFAERVVETVRQPLVVVDEDFKVMSVNRAFRETFSLSEKQANGAVLFDLGLTGRSPDELQAVLESVIESAESVEARETTMNVPGLGARTILVNARALVTGDEGEGDRILLSFEDVTEQRLREETRRREARQKDWFLAMLGHELRNPLAPLRNSVALLESGKLDERKHRDIVAIMDRQVTVLTRMVDELLDISRISSGKLDLRKELVELRELVRSTVQDHRRDLDNSGLEVTVDLPDSPIHVLGDGPRLSQVVGNLLSNARKYTDRGGTVAVRLYGESGRQSTCISITDTGRGMDEEMLERGFEPFQQGPRGPGHKETGLGVGLTLAKVITEGHGGTIWAESPVRDAAGTRVIVRLPLLGADELERRRPRTEDTEDRGPHPAPRRVLLIEDEPETASTTALLLEDEGHEVTIVADGESAIAAAEAFRPDVVLCDLSLAGPMSGYDVARELRAHPELGQVRLVAITAYGQPRDRRRAEELGFDRFEVKPLADDALRRLVADRGKRGSI